MDELEKAKRDMIFAFNETPFEKLLLKFVNWLVKVVSKTNKK